MNMYLAKNNERQGPFSIEQIGEMVRKGEFQMTDLAWREGMAGWEAIHKVPDVVAAILPPIPIEPPTINTPTTPPPIPNPPPENQPPLPSSLPPSSENASIVTETINQSKRHHENRQSTVSEKLRVPALVLCFFFGVFGLHAFYAGTSKTRAIIISFISGLDCFWYYRRSK